MNLSPTILISSLSPNKFCNLPKNSERYFCNSKILDVSALFNLSPSISISRFFEIASSSLASRARFNVSISFFKFSISSDKIAICSKVLED